MSVFHLSQGRQVRFCGDTIARTSAMPATPSQEKIAIAKVVGAKLMAVEKPMRWTMVFSRIRLQLRESHPRTKKSSFQAHLERTPGKTLFSSPKRYRREADFTLVIGIKMAPRRRRASDLYAVSSFGKLKRSTSVRTRSFWRLGGSRLVLVSSAMPWRLAQNNSERTSGFELRS